MFVRLAVIAVGLWASAALAEGASPFAPPPAPAAKIVRLLAPPALLDLEALQAFEQETGYQVAYDAYVGAPDLAEKWKEGPYDLVVLSGPALARQIAAGALAPLDLQRLPSAANLRPAVLAKLAAYDPSRNLRLAARLVRDRHRLRRRQGGQAPWRRADLVERPLQPGRRAQDGRLRRRIARRP